MTAGPPRDFERLYRSDPDPWDYRTAWYERRKYAVTLASLPRPHYRAVWEPACSIGELTALLADRADMVDATELSPTAVQAAQQRMARYSHVHVEQAALPAPAPGSPGSYDLVVLSEVLYYLPPDEREASLRAAEAAVGDDGDLVVVHWRHHPDDAFLAGASANEEVRSRPGWRSLTVHDDTDFVLDVLTRR